MISEFNYRSCIKRIFNYIAGGGIKCIWKYIFILNNKTIDAKYYWKVKLEKYYVPLFRYFELYNQQMKSKCQFRNLKLGTKLLVNELKKEVTIIPRIAVIITTHCSLKCSKCAALIPYFKSPENIDCKDIIRDIKAIENQVDKIYCLEFVGGEPFLHTDLDIMLKYAKKSDKIGIIEITTNAIVKIPKKVLLELRDSKVLVKISNYGFNKTNIIAITKLFKKMSIRYQILNLEQWQDFGEPIDYKKNRKQVDEDFYECFASALCRILYKGNLMICGRGACLYEQGLISDKYVNVNDDGFNTKSLYGFYIDRKYNFCRYCNYNHQNIKAAEQIM